MLQEDNSSQVITQPKNIVDADQTPAGQGFSHRSQKKSINSASEEFWKWNTLISNETSQALVLYIETGPFPWIYHLVI